MRQAILTYPQTPAKAQDSRCTEHPAGLDERSKLFRTQEDVGHFAWGRARSEPLDLGASGL